MQVSAILLCTLMGCEELCNELDEAEDRKVLAGCVHGAACVVEVFPHLYAGTGPSTLWVSTCCPSGSWVCSI